MSAVLHEIADGKVLEITLGDKLLRKDYRKFAPIVNRLVRKHHKIRMLILMHDFHGWSMGALWEDIKFDWKHFDHIERLAFVGEKKWESGMALLCRIFTTAKIRDFNTFHADEARNWVMEGVAEPQLAG
ncbi:MAG TPA: STAS/SEC14 domain-containing protein [Fimbriiglobus sp.]|jgi:hypothetical protein